MYRILGVVLYILVFLPIWMFRKVLGGSRFGRLYHRAPSAWDRLAAPAGPPEAAGTYREQGV